MSADNTILVVHRTRWTPLNEPKREHWIVNHYVSFYPQTKLEFEYQILCDAIDGRARSFTTREEALAFAHDLEKDDWYPIEYGVTELDLDTLTDENFDSQNGTHVAFI